MKVFLIGCGDIARHHGRAVVRLGGSITGCFDISQANAQLCADEFGCPIVGYDEIESYMPGSDYAVISTPPTKRLDYVEMVLKHHVPLYLEKPVACTMEDAMKTKALADRYDGKIMVGFAHYYRPAYQKMLELVKTGMFGEPVDIAFSRLSPGFGFHAKNLGASWRTDPDLACGMTVESVSHDWKLITAMAGALLFGALPAFLLTWGAVALGSAVVFQLARRLGRSFADRFVSRALSERYLEVIRRKRDVFLAMAFLFPFFPDDILCILAGLTDIPFPRFVVLVILFRPWGLLVASAVGGSVVSIPPWGMALLGLGGLALFLVGMKYGDRAEEALLRRFRHK